MSKYKKVIANGYWNDNKNPIENVILALGEWDGVEDAEDTQIAYFLGDAEPIGNHGEFTITDAKTYNEKPPMQELMCQVQMYFTVPEGMTPEEYKKYLTNLTMLDMVRQFNEAYATDWLWSDEEGINWKPV